MAKIIKATKSIDYDFEIQFRLGKYDSVADTLPYCASFASLSLAQGVEWLDWEDEQQWRGKGLHFINFRTYKE